MNVKNERFNQVEITSLFMDCLIIGKSTLWGEWGGLDFSSHDVLIVLVISQNPNPKGEQSLRSSFQK